MTLLRLAKTEKPLRGKVRITGSKSETNRLLILQQIYPNLQIENLSNSDDSQLMQQALSNTTGQVDIGHAGTAMRFLTAYLSVQTSRETVLTGSHRMKDRPIKLLVDALRALGASIDYLEKEGYPPIQIKGSKLTGASVLIDGGVSSQYITALLLIAPMLDNGLQLNFKGTLTSRPYIDMTVDLLRSLGVVCTWGKNSILIQPTPVIADKTLVVESDWSAASYYYSMVALSEQSEIELTAFKAHSLQGDAVLVDIYRHLGVETTHHKHAIVLRNTGVIKPSYFNELDLSNAPDIAQTIVVTCFGMGIPCFLTGLHTLKIKETDRLVALKNEIEKLGGVVYITQDTLQLEAADSIRSHVAVATYHDHRMAMAFAPLITRVPLSIEDAGVVSKSYPSFWEDMEKITR